MTGVEWDEGISRWIIITDKNDNIRARFVYLGSGVLDVPEVPDVLGLKEFEGHWFHTSRWDYDYTGGDSCGLVNLTGKRVAVVGTATSAIQCVPVPAEYVQELFVIQRRARISAVVSDPATAESLKPYYNLGCKRPQFGDVYPVTFNKPNMTLIDTQGRGVDCLSRGGFEFEGARYDVDCIIFTPAFAGGLPISEAGGFAVIGRRGATLASKCRHGTRSLHGIRTNGFPNLFIIGGVSQAVLTINLSHGVDEQARHVAALISRCDREGASSVEVTSEAEARCTAVIEAKAAERSGIDLQCTPADHVDLFNSTYGGGPLEYFDVLDELLQKGFSDDVVLA